MRTFNGLVRLAAASLAALVATVAHAQTSSNPASIAVPSNTDDGRSPLYPSPIVVSSGPASIGYVSVTLRGFTHSFVGDVYVLLVSPGGQKIMLMASANGSGNAANSTLTFTPDATATLPNADQNVVSGVYACSVYDASTSLPAPAPAGPYANSLAPLIGANANGTWNLYVFDAVPIFDSGSFATGWSISFESSTTAFSYQGVLSAGDTPIGDDANVRFTLCNNPTDALNVARLAPPVTRNFTGVVNGLITTALDFGSAIDTNQVLWLNIEVESPPGSGFVSLTPRQAIMPTPQARTAVRADDALRAVIASQLAPGRARILGEAGAASASPGIWFASPANAPIDRAFVGMRDDSNVGLYNATWNLLLHSNGNVAIGDSSGAAPAERLVVNGGVQVAISSRLAFGAVGDFAASANNTDATFFQRVNTASNVTELRLILGDDPGAIGTDSLRICTTSVGGGLIEQIRFQSDGIALKPGGGSWGVLSDPRAKHDIAPLSGTLDKLLNLRGYSFQYNDDRVSSGLALPGVQVGLMADEVAQVFPDWVSTDASGTRFVTERSTTALMVEALRDLRAEKDAAAAAAQSQIDALRAQNAELQARLERLEAAINATKP